MDNDFTRRMQDWLSQPRQERDIEAGALMLLQLNRNRILYQNILRKPEQMHDKLEYELRKHLRYRLDQMTLDDVVRMDRSLMPKVERMITQDAPVISYDDDAPDAKVARGRRADHDSLPPDIQLLYETNGERYYKIKQLFNQLKAMNDAPPCDRYEYLKQLKDLDVQYREAWKRYDEYTEGATVGGSRQQETADDAAAMARKVSAARKFLSQNKAKLAELRTEDPAEYAALLNKVQERYDFLMDSRAGISEAQEAELKKLGVV